MSKFLLKNLKGVLNLIVGVVVVVSFSGCDKVEPAVAKVSPDAALPGATLTIAGTGLSTSVKVGEVEAVVKSRKADSILVVELPKKLKPGNYDLIVTDKGTKISTKPVKVRVLDVVAVPAGTSLKVRVVESIGSGQNQVGDTFGLLLDQPLVVNGRTIASAGSEILGKVTQVADAGRVKGRAMIEFTLIELKPGKHAYPLVTDNYLSQAQSTKKSDAITIGGGTGVGAAIGGILGGKKGAIIGGGVGGAAGTGVVLATQGKDVAIPSGSLFNFVLSQSFDVDMTGAQ
jgi:hypothetical protein